MEDPRIRKYTVPKVNYNYSRTSWDEYMNNQFDDYKTIRSSFIPITVIDDKMHWLLGSFHDYPKQILTDFGGSCTLFWNKGGKGRIIHQLSPFGCAITETQEESKGLLLQPILRILGTLDKDSFHIYVGKNPRKKEKIYFFFIPLIYEDISNLPAMFDSLPETGETLGPLDFYLESDILENKLLTTYNLTDFINYLR